MSSVTNCLGRRSGTASAPELFSGKRLKRALRFLPGGNAARFCRPGFSHRQKERLFYYNAFSPKSLNNHLIRLFKFALGKTVNLNRRLNRKLPLNFVGTGYFFSRRDGFSILLNTSNVGCMPGRHMKDPVFSHSSPGTIGCIINQISFIFQAGHRRNRPLRFRHTAAQEQGEIPI